MWISTLNVPPGMETVIRRICRGRIKWSDLAQLKRYSSKKQRTLESWVSTSSLIHHFLQNQLKIWLGVEYKKNIHPYLMGCYQFSSPWVQMNFMVFLSCWIVAIHQFIQKQEETTEFPFPISTLSSKVTFMVWVKFLDTRDFAHFQCVKQRC